MKSGDNKYPVVVFANGTGSTSSTYKAFLEHLSSWGFVAIGNDDKNTRTGASLEKTIEFLIQENENKDSIFYHKIDLNNIGISGHSQGGPAVFNMVTKQENYNLLPETINKVIARKKNVDHGDSYLQFDGYMTAWFMWQLQGDEEAAKAFTGENAELLSNPNWQDVRIGGQS